MPSIYTITDTLAELIGGWCAAVLYGINVCVFFFCVVLLIQKRRSGKHVSILLLASTSAQFIISTIHIAMSLQLLMNAFLRFEGGADVYLSNERRSEQIGMKVAYFANSIIGDAILVWRLYAVWGRRWMVALVPSVMVLGFAVNAYIAVGILASDAHYSWLTIRNYFLSAWALSIATQLAATTLISYRIWKYTRHSQLTLPTRSATRLVERENPPYMRIIFILVESGLIYTVGTILLLVFFSINSQASNIMGKCMGQISAIIPTLIVVGVNLRVQSDVELKETYQRSMKTIQFAPAQFRGRRTSPLDTMNTAYGEEAAVHDSVLDHGSDELNPNGRKRSSQKNHSESTLSPTEGNGESFVVVDMRMQGDAVSNVYPMDEMRK